MPNYAVGDIQGCFLEFKEGLELIKFDTSQDFLWITERSGLVSRINIATGEKHIILDIENIVTTESESGLLGMEFHPNFETNPLVFIVYTYYQGFYIKERLSAFTYNSEQDVLEGELLY